MKTKNSTKPRFLIDYYDRWWIPWTIFMSLVAILVGIFWIWGILIIAAGQLGLGFLLNRSLERRFEFKHGCDYDQST